MKQLLMISTVLAILSVQALAQPVIFSGSDVKTQKSTIDINGGAKVISQSGDPTAVAVNAPKGSLLLDTNSGKSYLKSDAGSSTNWVQTYINDSQITTAKINDLAVTTGKINDSAVTTAKINDGAVTQAKLPARASGSSVAAGGVATSASSGAFSTTSGPYVDVTNLSVTITTTGRPVFIGLMPDESGGGGGNNSIFKLIPVTSVAGAQVAILRGATNIYDASFAASNLTSAYTIIPISAVWKIDSVAAGTYTYKVQVRTYFGAGENIQIYYVKLIAYEL